jgi:hypothetical protein
MPEKCVETMPLSELVNQTNRAVERRLKPKKRSPEASQPRLDHEHHDVDVPEAVPYEDEIPEALPHQDDAPAP